MSFIDKAKHKAEQVIGEIKERAGRASGDGRLETEGKKDRASGKVKQSGDSVKDAASNLGDAVQRDKR